MRKCYVTAAGGLSTGNATLFEVILTNFRKSIPSLNALLVLEAVARHRSITQAAGELGVTQAAVSRQIGALEAELDTPLFHRRHRAIEPTPECLELAASLSETFTTIAEGVRRIRARNRSEVVTIGATSAFSGLWLLPRLSDLRDRFPNVQIRIVTRDERIDLGSGEVDVAVRFGQPPFEDGAVVASRSDVVFLVCAPLYARRLAEAGTFQSGKVDLIGSDNSQREWFAWKEWFSRANLKASVTEPTLRVSHYDDALQAARAGQGVALGWNLLVRSFLDDGSLVRVGDSVVRPDGCFNVVVPARGPRSPTGRLVAEWLAERLEATHGADATDAVPAAL